MTKRLVVNEQLSLARRLNEVTETTLDYEEAVRLYFGPEDGPVSPSMAMGLRKVALWCPGNGRQSTFDAIALTLLTMPENFVVFLSSRDEEFANEVKSWLVKVLEGWTKTRVHCVLAPHAERLEVLGELEGLEHIVVYGSDETCKKVLERVDPLVPRTVYRHKTSVSIDTSDSPEFEGYFRDAISGGSVGCLNSCVLYADLRDVDLEELERTYVEAARSLKGTYQTEDPWTFGLKLVESGVDYEAVRVIANGYLVVRKPLAPERGFPFTGIGGGTYVIVDTPSPLETFLSEWEGLGEYLSAFSGNEIFEEVYELGASRYSLPGDLQTPDSNWYHDGMPLFPPTYRLAY